MVEVGPLSPIFKLDLCFGFDDNDDDADDNADDNDE